MYNNQNSSKKKIVGIKTRPGHGILKGRDFDGGKYLCILNDAAKKIEENP